ncbi:MAG: hypothetical protein WCX64_03720 [Candidatus Micrarchaeia archaeon]
MPQKTAPKQVAKFRQSLYGDKQATAQAITPESRVSKTPFFVTLTRWGGKQFSGLAKNTTFSLEEAEVFEFMGFGVTSDEYKSTYTGLMVYGLAICAVLAAGLVLLLRSSVDMNILFIFAGILALLPIILSYIYLKLPFSLAENEKKLALAYTPEIVNYLVMSMRLTPNLEKAVDFAASHGRGKIAEDLKTVLWRTQLGTYFSVEEGLDELAYRWGPYSDEFKHALMLIRSSVMEADSNRRSEMLERAAADVLEGSKEKMDIYARQLSQPTVYLYYFGILLPLLLAIILPIGGAMTGMDIAKAEYIFLVYNIFIPIGVYLFGSNILGTRPPTYVPPDIPEDFFSLPKKGIWEVGSLKIPYKAAAIAAFFLLVGAGFLADKLVLDAIPSYEAANNPVENMLHIPWLYDNYGILFGQYSISGLLLGFAVCISIYLVGKYSARKKVQDEVRHMETEFKDALYVLASRLGENRPMEEALRQAVEFLPKSKIASDVFRKILQNISEMGMTIESAIFDPTFGAVKNYPSEIIRGGMQIMVDSVELGVNVAAKSLLSLSLQIRNQQKIDEMLRKLLSDVTTMLGTMSMFIAPIVLAVVGALQRMVTGAITSSCASQSTATAGTASTASLGGLSTGISFCPEGKSISDISADPATFVIIMGVYCIEIVILLTYFNSQIEDTNNELHTYMSIAYALPIATFLYVAVSFAVGMFMNLG